MTETERITNEVMDRHIIPPEGQVKVDQEWAETRDEGFALEGVRNGLAMEVLAGLILWGMWELHQPIMILAYWLVGHAH